MTKEIAVTSETETSFRVFLFLLSGYPIYLLSDVKGWSRLCSHFSFSSIFEESILLELSVLISGYS